MKKHLLKNTESENWHPETKEGEVWEQNVKLETFERLPYTTKRLGKIAYNVFNEPVDGLLPMFLSIEESEQIEQDRRAIFRI